MKLLSLLKRCLKSRYAPELKPACSPYPDGAMDIEAWGSDIQRMVRESGKTPEECLEIRDRADLRCIELDRIGQDLRLEQIKQEIKKRLMLEVAQTVDRVFEEAIKKR